MGGRVPPLARRKNRGKYSMPSVCRRCAVGMASACFRHAVAICFIFCTDPPIPVLTWRSRPSFWLKESTRHASTHTGPFFEMLRKQWPLQRLTNSVLQSTVVGGNPAPLYRPSLPPLLLLRPPPSPPQLNFGHLRSRNLQLSILLVTLGCRCQH